MPDFSTKPDDVFGSSSHRGERASQEFTQRLRDDILAIQRRRRLRKQVMLVLLGLLVLATVGWLTGCGPKASSGPDIAIAPRTDFFMGVFGDSEWKKKFESLKIESREDFVKLLGEVSNQQHENDRLVNQAAIDKANAEAEIERLRLEKEAEIEAKRRRDRAMNAVIWGFGGLAGLLGLCGVGMIVMGVIGRLRGGIGNGIMLLAIGGAVGAAVLFVVPALDTLGPVAAWIVGLTIVGLMALAGVRIYRSLDDSHGETLLKELMNQRMEANTPEERLRLDGQIAAVQHVYFPGKPTLHPGTSVVPT